jgi:hypothetical protein
MNVRVTDESAERVARNNDIFRRANEEIHATAGSLGFDAPIPFLCECTNERCTEVVRLAAADYAEIRSHPRRFVVAPGHQTEADGHERVLERRDGYETTEKVGEAGEIAEELAGD